MLVNKEPQTGTAAVCAMAGVVAMSILLNRL
jgi:hypothetical protein